MKRRVLKGLVIFFAMILVGCAASNPPRTYKPVKRPPPPRAAAAVQIPKDAGSCRYTNSCSRRKVEKKAAIPIPRANVALRDVPAQEKVITKRDTPKSKSVRLPKSKTSNAKQKFNVDSAIKQLKDM